jgi:hypothetical protein
MYILVQRTSAGEQQRSQSRGMRRRCLCCAHPSMCTHDELGSCPPQFGVSLLGQELVDRWVGTVLGERRLRRCKALVLETAAAGAALRHVMAGPDNLLKLPLTSLHQAPHCFNPLLQPHTQHCPICALKTPKD